MEQIRIPMSTSRCVMLVDIHGTQPTARLRAFRFIQGNYEEVPADGLQLELRSRRQESHLVPVLPDVMKAQGGLCGREAMILDDDDESTGWRVRPRLPGPEEGDRPVCDDCVEILKRLVEGAQ